jgi:hypothetical protein
MFDSAAQRESAVTERERAEGYGIDYGEAADFYELAGDDDSWVVDFGWEPDQLG